MGESAITVTAPGDRSARRYANAHRISRCAQQLADERGDDGFTMDELAETAGVSRRTLFNYFPSKDDAILGPVPEIRPEHLATFRAGGPHGNLIDDMAVLADDLLRSELTTREDIALSHRVMQANPRLMALAHQRFRLMTQDFVNGIEEREGDRFDPARARVAIAVLAGIFALTLEVYLTDSEQRPVADLFAVTLRHARELLA